jgi:hypothetical protein
MYLTAKYWSGSLNVASMRLHSSLADATKEMQGLVMAVGFNGKPGFVEHTRCYEFIGKDKPRNITHQLGIKGQIL